MKNKLGIILLLAIMLMTFLGIIIIASENNTLVFAVSVDVDEMDPGNSYITYVTDNIFEGLVKFKEGTTSIEPCLATSWEISSDGKEITFNLRKGIKFHDGTNFNADAVVFSIERQYDQKHPYHRYGKWYMWKWMLNDVDKIEKLDDYTVKLFLKRSNASILNSLAMGQISIVSPANAEIYQEDAFKHPCGTGPFRFVKWIKDDHITLEANDYYWKGRPKIDRLIFKVIPNPSVRLMALEIGEVHGIEHPDPVDFDRIKGNSDFILMSIPSMNIGFLAMNTGYGYIDENKNGFFDPDIESLVKTTGYFEPLTKKKVRQAINMAIDKQAIVDNIYMGTAIKAKNGMPPFMLGYNDEIIDYPYDPEKSKELLSEAGYPNGFEVILHITTVSRPYIFDPPKIAEAIQSYLAVLGIKVKIKKYGWANFVEEILDGKHQICLTGWTGDNGDPDNFMNAVYGTDKALIGNSSNYSFYINSQAQELLYKALSTYDNQQRSSYYKQVQEMIHEDAGWVYLVHAKQNVAFRNNIKGFTPHPTGRLFFYPVWIE